jgi:hypothetical protein
MKTLFVSLAALLIAFSFGCQENSITDPIVPDHTKFLGTMDENNFASEDILNKDMLSALYPNVIKLEGMLFDPSHLLNSFADISGVVRYGLGQINTDKRPPHSAIKVRLYINAELKGGCSGQHHPWLVSSTSEDLVYTSASNQSVYYLEKSFRVKNTCCSPLNLVLKFQVDEKSLTLVSMRLVKVKISNLPIPDPEM